MYNYQNLNEHIYFFIINKEEVIIIMIVHFTISYGNSLF